MDKVKCPYCGYKKDITVNAEMKKFTSLCSCQKCHKQYWYVTEFGRVSVKKKQYYFLEIVCQSLYEIGLKVNKRNSHEYIKVLTNLQRKVMRIWIMK